MLYSMIFISIFLIACTPQATQADNAARDKSLETNNAVSDVEDKGDVPGELPLWMTAKLKDINSGETFSIEDFKGKPVLMESFAVWCPICTQQQKETKKLEEEGTDIISVNLDTDPNEDEERVKGHLEKHGFDWRYAISPTAVTQSLTDDFGPKVLQAPLAPMVLICPDQSFELLSFGVKSKDKLKEAVAQNCA
jgi:cytochrome oxidase Cu insertion factor (SCO1/SenC/PrrC family)